jgi:modification target Cys-rich repeat protein
MINSTCKLNESDFVKLEQIRENVLILPPTLEKRINEIVVNAHCGDGSCSGMCSGGCEGTCMGTCIGDCSGTLTGRPM